MTIHILIFKRGVHALRVIRSRHQRCFVRKSGLRNFAKFTGKQLYQSLFFNKVFKLYLKTLAQVFPCDFCEIFKNTFLQNSSERLLLFEILMKWESDFHLSNENCCLLHWKPFKNDGKSFLFYLKSSFCSQSSFVLIHI